MSEENGEEAKKEKPSAPTTPFATTLREIVAAALGILIIVGTLVLLWPCLSASPLSDNNIQAAQAIFSILGGWGGVILGYYFGRIPAERAADKAEAVAATAESEKDKAEKKVEAGLAKIEAIEKRLDSIIAVLEKEVG